jgi:uncharacterized circularly permuted ATP-grasp superfamily protein
MARHMLAQPVTHPSLGEQAFHEFYADHFEPRTHYRPLWEHIRQMGQAALAAKAREAQLALYTEGVTFTVYGDGEEGIERVWPFDVLPRLVPAAEWAFLEAGLKQRVRALNLFLHDVYHEQRVLRDGAARATPSSCCSRPVSGTPPTSSTRSSPRRWASSSRRGATSSSTTTSCT